MDFNHTNVKFLEAKNSSMKFSLQNSNKVVLLCLKLFTKIKILRPIHILLREGHREVEVNRHGSRLGHL